MANYPSPRGAASYPKNCFLFRKIVSLTLWWLGVNLATRDKITVTKTICRRLALFSLSVAVPTLSIIDYCAPRDG